MLVVLTICLCAAVATAQTAPPIVLSQVNWLNTIPAGGGTLEGGGPAGQTFAVNQNGDIFLGDHNGLDMFNGKTGAVTILGAWGNTSAVAVDSYNNVYVANIYSAGWMVKVPYLGNGTYAAFSAPTNSTPYCTGFGSNASADTAECLVQNIGNTNNYGGFDSYYYGISALLFDAQGDLFWSVGWGNNSAHQSIFECNVACLSATSSPANQAVELYREPASTASPTVTELSVGTLAIDPWGNLFFTDSALDSNGNSHSSNLNELPLSTGAGYGGVTTGYAAAPTVLYTYTPATPGNDEIDAVAVDQTSGTVYFAGTYEGIFAVPNTGGTIPLSGGQPTNVYGVSPQGAKMLTLDGKGNLYIVSYQTVINTGGADTVGSISVGGVSVPGFTQIGNSATLTNIDVVFNDGGCSTSSITLGSTSSEYGAAVPASATSCTSMLFGDAYLPLTLTFTPSGPGGQSTQLTVTDSNNNTGSAAVSGSGPADIFLSQTNWLLAFPNGGALSSADAAGTSMAVNSDGNVLVATEYGNQVLLVNPQTAAVTVVANWPSYNIGPVTIDSQNNLYIGGLYTNNIIKIPYVGGAYVAAPDPTTTPANCTGTDTAECNFGSNLTNSTNGWYFGVVSMAFDPAGDFFFALTNSNTAPDAIYECTAACIATGTPAATMIYQEPQSVTVTQLNVGALAIDPWGNLFFTDSALDGKLSNGSASSNVNELPVSSGAGFGGVTTGFAAAPTVLYTMTIATPSSYDDEIDGVAVDPKTGTVYFAAQYDGIFALVNNAGVVNPASLYTVGTQGSKLLAEDPNGNFWGASYSSVTGSSGDTLFETTVGTVAFPETAVGSSTTNSATMNPVSVILNDGGCTTPETVNFTNPADFSAKLIPPVSPATTTCASTLSGGSQFPVAVTFAPLSGGNLSEVLGISDSNGNSGTATLTGAAKALPPQVITFTNPAASESVVYGTAPITLAATGGASGNPVTFTVDASSTAGAGSISGGVLTIAGAGTIIIDANQAGNSSFAAAAQVQLTITVTQAPQTITFPAPASPVYLGAAPITLSATASSGLPVTFTVDASSTAGAGSISGDVLTITSLGTIVIDANQVGNADYTAAPQVQQTITVKTAPVIPLADDVLLGLTQWVVAFPNGGALSSADAAGTSMAVNSDGNILLSTEYGGSILMISPTGTITTLGSVGNAGPVTIDAQNNLYIGALYSATIVKIPYVAGAYATFNNNPTVACTGTDTAACYLPNLTNSTNGYYFGPVSLAFDAAGDFFFALTNSNTAPDAIYECTVACLTTGTPAATMIYQEPQSVTTTQLNVGSMAVDSSGNLFFTDSALNSKGSNESEYSNLNELPVSAGAGFGGVTTGYAATPTVLYTLTPGTPGNYDDEIDGVVIDPTNDTVYFTAQYDGIFGMVNNKGVVNPASMYTVATQGSKLLAEDSFGNFWGASYGTAINSGGADTLFWASDNYLTFPNTMVGQTSSTAMQTPPASASVILNDGGCATPETVSFTNPADFSAALNPPVAPATTTCASTLSGGSSFPATVIFAPTVAGNLSETLAIKDSDGNSGSASLNGVSISLIAQSITFTSPAAPETVVFGVAPITLAATGGASGNPVVFTVDAKSTAGAGSISGNLLTVTGTGVIIIDANQAGSATYAAAPQVKTQIIVSKATQAITFTNPTAPETVVYGVAPIDLTATGGNSGNAVVFTIDPNATTAGAGSLSGSTLTITGSGRITIFANQPGNGNYEAAPEVALAITVTKATQAITFTNPESSESVPFGTAPITLSAAGGSSGSAVVFSIDKSSTAGAGSLSDGTLTITGLGMIVIDANQAGNADYTAAPEAQVTITVTSLGTVATPTFSIPGGTYYGTATTVALSTTTAGATIYYTKDGSTPTTGSSKYTGAIALANPGTYNVKAIAVEAGYTASTVATATYVISSIPPNFTFRITPTSLDITAGQSGTVTATIAPDPTFPSSITFTCSGLPDGATCPAVTITPTGSQPISASVTIATTANSIVARSNSNPLVPGATLAAALCCFLGFKKRRRLQMLLVLAISAIGLGLFTGCGAQWSPTFSTTTVKVTATSTTPSLVKSADFTLTVHK
jgi:hypothetical protein